MSMSYIIVLEYVLVVAVRHRNMTEFAKILNFNADHISMYSVGNHLRGTIK